MTTRRIQVKNLVAGQCVALPGCVDIERVICRVGKNSYKVTFKDKEVIVPRSSLAVLKNGRWQHGPVNADQESAL